MPTPLDMMILLFIGLLGACVGSFLNVVVYRLPAGLSLLRPASRCPKCLHPLAWYDNVPVAGWLWLRGKCRYCREPISARYPLVELFSALLFVGYVWAIYFQGASGFGPFTYRDVGSAADLIPLPPERVGLYPWQQWAGVAGHLWVLATLLAAGLIDFDTYTVHPKSCWLAAVVGLACVVAGAVWWFPPVSSPGLPLMVTLNGPALPLGWSVGRTGLTVAVGSTIGWAVMTSLYAARWIRPSFPMGEPTREIDSDKPESEQTVPAMSPNQIRREVLREVPWLAVPALCALLMTAIVMWLPVVAGWMTTAAERFWVAQLGGAVLGMWLAAGTIWLVRIVTTALLGRVAMGLGDVHLMLPIGVVCGPVCGPSALFVGAVAGLGLTIMTFVIKGRREVSFGQYLSIGCLVCLLLRSRLENFLSPGLFSLLGVNVGG